MKCRFRPLWILALLLVFAVIEKSYAADEVVLYTNYGANNTVTLHQMNPDGTADTEVEINLPYPQNPTWSRDGGLVALTSPFASAGFVYIDTYNAFVFNPATGAVEQITSWPETLTGDPNSDYTKDYTQVFSKAFSSDGERLAVVSMSYSEHWQYLSGSWYVNVGFFPSFEVYDMQGNLLEQVGESGSGAMHQGDGIDWVPNEELLICPWTVEAGAGLATALVAVAPAEGALDAARFRKLTHPQFFKYWGHYGAGFCYDQDFQPAVGPVSNRVVYVRERNCIDGGHPMPSTISVRMVDLNRARDRAIYAVPKGQYVSHLSWAPDESKLVLSCGAEVVAGDWPMSIVDYGTAHIALLNPNGTGFQQISGLGDDYPAWSPPGSEIVPISQSPASLLYFPER